MQAYQQRDGLRCSEMKTTPTGTKTMATVASLVQRLPGKEIVGVSEDEHRNRLAHAKKSALGQSLDLGSDVEIAQSATWVLRSAFDSNLVVTDGTFYGYCRHQGIWKPIDGRALFDFVTAYDGAAVEGGEKTRFIRLNRSKIESILKIMHSLETCDPAQEKRLQFPDFFSGSTPGIACANGFAQVDGDGVSLREHSPDFRARGWVNWKYDPEAENKAWVGALDRIFAGDPDANEKKLALQQFVGACLCGIAPDYAKCMILVGDGANGKSIVMDTVEQLFPEGGVTSVPPQQWSKEYYAAQLRTPMLNAVSEMPEGQILDSSSFKAVITGDPIMGRAPYEQPTLFRPAAGHLFNANNLPATVDSSHGFWRRLIVIAFNHDFSADPKRRGKVDVLSEILTQGTGVFTWALNGACRLIRNGEYTTPSSHEGELKEWRRDSDSVADFVASCCTVGGKTRAAVVYQSFVDWAEKSGRGRLSSRKFGRRMTTLKLHHGRDKQGVFYTVGVRQRGEWDT